MAEPELDEPSPAPPPWLYDAEQIEQKYEEAVAAAGEACAEDTKIVTRVCSGLFLAFSLWLRH